MAGGVFDRQWDPHSAAHRFKSASGGAILPPNLNKHICAQGSLYKYIFVNVTINQIFRNAIYTLFLLYLKLNVSLL